ncbi:caffeine-induced death protein 2 [Stagonosporopsis vannaccii]|nr:caffeine-induced death protein 2 [Stagonosporopsis vannaccii]
MSQPSAAAHLTPQFCFNQTALRDFLRISRSTIDDSITQNLNALLTPAQRGFDPTSTSTRQLSGPARSIPPTQCDEFKQRVLFPSWAVRSDVLDYCAGVATSPDPDDPDSVLRQVEDAKARERVVDERLDPYSGRYFPQEARTESLALLMRNERAVEKIIRSRSWGVIAERCGSESVDAERAFDEWRKKQ